MRLTSRPSAGMEPAIRAIKVYALDRTATGIDSITTNQLQIRWKTTIRNNNNTKFALHLISYEEKFPLLHTVVHLKQRTLAGSKCQG
jgi:hypothetical protein